jgi:transposase
VLHADETPVGMLKPGNKKTHKAYIWTYCTTSFNDTKAVVFNFAETRSGENVRAFLRQDDQACKQGWRAPW